MIGVAIRGLMLDIVINLAFIVAILGLHGFGSPTTSHILFGVYLTVAIIRCDPVVARMIREGVE